MFDDGDVMSLPEPAGAGQRPVAPAPDGHREAGAATAGEGCTEDEAVERLASMPPGAVLADVIERLMSQLLCPAADLVPGSAPGVEQDQGAAPGGAISSRGGPGEAVDGLLGDDGVRRGDTARQRSDQHGNTTRQHSGTRHHSDQHNGTARQHSGTRHHSDQLNGTAGDGGGQVSGRGCGAPQELVADPGERALLRAAGAVSLEVEGAQTSGALGAEVLAGLGAQALSELVAACGRLASWASWAQALASACLSRTPELRMGPAPKAPYEALPRFVTSQENQFNTTSEMACRLGVSRARANRILQRGQALLSGGLQPTEALHRVGLIDEAKTSLIATRLEGAPEEVAQAVQDTVLPRAAHRTHAQLARDLDRALTAHDPEGTSQRRQRNTAQRHVTRPRPAGQGVHEMRMLMPTMDAFLLDATLDAVAASARAAGDERTACQLRADALVSMSLATLRQSHNRASTTAHQPPAPSIHHPGRQHLIEQEPSTQESPAHRRRLMPDGVPLEGLLTALSDLVGSHSPWWMPSSTSPVPLPPGLSINIDVTVPLDQLIGDRDLHTSSDQPPPHATTPATADSAAKERTADHRTPTTGRSLPTSNDGDPPTATDAPLLAAEHRNPSTTTDRSLPTSGWARSSASTTSFSPPSPASPAPATARTPVPTTTPHVSVGRASGPVPLVVARALAAGGTWRRLVTDPVSGAVIDVGRRRYRPPAGLRDLVTARDRSCTHPGCDIPAHRCDLDHITPWAQGGATSLDNLTSLCQSHHLLKHTPGWSLTRALDGALTWRTPTGARYRRDHDGTITMLPRRIGAHSALQAATRLPQALARAMTDAVLARLEQALAQAAPTAPTSLTPLLQTRGPRSGRPGDYEARPYPEELHALGITALLDEAIPF